MKTHVATITITIVEDDDGEVIQKLEVLPRDLDNIATRIAGIMVFRLHEAQQRFGLVPKWQRTVGPIRQEGSNEAG